MLHERVGTVRHDDAVANMHFIPGFVAGFFPIWSLFAIQLRPCVVAAESKQYTNERMSAWHGTTALLGVRRGRTALRQKQGRVHARVSVCTKTLLPQSV